MAGIAASTPTYHRSKGVVRCEVELTTDASGDVSASRIGKFFGKVAAVFYDGGLDASAVITFKDGNTGATLFSYTTGTEGTPTRFIPTTNVVDNAGTAITAADEAPNVNRPIKVAGNVDIVVASGGNAETGTIALVIDEANNGAGLGERALTV